MTSLDDLADPALPRERRIALALKFAIAVLNDTPRFKTHLVDDRGRTLSSYDVLPKLEAVLRETGHEGLMPP
jgi:hypothetical protein